MEDNKKVTLAEAKAETSKVSKKEIVHAYKEKGIDAIYSGHEKAFFLYDIGFVPIEIKK